MDPDEILSFLHSSLVLLFFFFFSSSLRVFPLSRFTVLPREFKGAERPDSRRPRRGRIGTWPAVSFSSSSHNSPTPGTPGVYESGTNPRLCETGEAPARSRALATCAPIGRSSRSGSGSRRNQEEQREKSRRARLSLPLFGFGASSSRCISRCSPVAVC